LLFQNAEVNMVKKVVKKTEKKVALPAKRWWNHQLIRSEDDEGAEVFVLAEIYWKQEGKKKPSVWYIQEPCFSGGTPEEVLARLESAIASIGENDIVEEDMLPDDNEMTAEYEKYIEESDHCGKEGGCGGGCCGH